MFTCQTFNTTLIVCGFQGITHGVDVPSSQSESQFDHPQLICHKQTTRNKWITFDTTQVQSTNIKRNETTLFIVYTNNLQKLYLSQNKKKHIKLLESTIIIALISACVECKAEHEEPALSRSSCFDTSALICFQTLPSSTFPGVFRRQWHHRVKWDLTILRDSKRTSR